MRHQYADSCGDIQQCAYPRDAADARAVARADGVAATRDADDEAVDEREEEIVNGDLYKWRFTFCRKRLKLTKLTKLTVQIFNRREK